MGFKLWKENRAVFWKDTSALCFTLRGCGLLFFLFFCPRTALSSRGRKYKCCREGLIWCFYVCIIQHFIEFRSEFGFQQVGFVYLFIYVEAFKPNLNWSHYKEGLGQNRTMPESNCNSYVVSALYVTALTSQCRLESQSVTQLLGFVGLIYYFSILLV